jgi:FkbM family methyltransferase
MEKFADSSGRIERHILYVAGLIGKDITGILHVGAHLAEELKIYENSLGVDREHIIWVDALQEKIDKLKAAGIPNCYQAVLDATEHETDFNITNFTKSSSLYNLKIHLKIYPDIITVEKRRVKTETLDTFFKRIDKDPRQYNVWIFDIQGAEYPVLKSSLHLLSSVDIIQIEVCLEELYESMKLLPDLDALLQENGFKRFHTEMTSDSWGDAIYVRESLLSEQR